MAEIKSTLDLVMEKTRNLSLSDKEKQAHKNKEIGSRMLGLVNKFLDKAISLDRFNSEYRVLKKEYALTGKGNAHLIKEICGQIELGKDNQALLGLLAEFEVPDLEGLTSVLHEFQNARETAAGKRRKILKDQLAKTRFISGSAVVPNLENDHEWRKETAEIKAGFETKLNQAKIELLAG
jgi:hypothetical protein